VPEKPEVDLLARAHGDWSVFGGLADLDEARLRRVLRFHRERSFDGTGEDDADVGMRHRLDEALERLSSLELGIQVGVLKHYDFASIRGLELLLGSSAFTRYLTSYLYFDVLFIAERVLGPESRLPLDATDENREINEWPVALPTPPAIEPPHAPGAGPAISRLLAFSKAAHDASDVEEATHFLDDYVHYFGEQADYELWLRGLGRHARREPGDRVNPDLPGEARFERLTAGLWKFARMKADFYLALERDISGEFSGKRGAAKEEWCAKNPLSARFGVADLYLLARLLRADVSRAGVVTYGEGSWLSLMAARLPAASEEAAEFARVDEVLHAVFDYACDLIQNAVQIARDGLLPPKKRYEAWPAETVAWRAAYDEELAEIAQQRKERRFDDGTQFGAARVDPVGPRRSTWSRRIRTGEHVEGLIGLALSGGGIRSATFNLGVLQRLQEIDLLRKVDYLSTVSGGGYIGAWLLANVRRTHYWLSQLTDWSPSIAHLRRFSNYLAPRTGLMSADTWTMWGTWIRNAFLIQLTAITWVALFLVLTRLGKTAFSAEIFGTVASNPYNLAVLGGFVVALTVFICFNLKQPSRSSTEKYVLICAVAPAWIGSFLTAAMLWGRWHGRADSYSTILADAWAPWSMPLAALFLGLCVMSWFSVDGKRATTYIGGLFQAAASMGVVYLGLCGVRWLFGQWGPNPNGVWLAYVIGPPLVLLVMTLAVFVIIGLIGHDSEDWRREWWTRFGSWQGIVAVCFLGLGLISITGPWLVERALDQPWNKWTTVAGWIATVIGGLLTGNSSQSSGEGDRTLSAQAMAWFAKIAALVFIVGAVLFTSAGLHAVLLKIWPAGVVPNDYWGALNTLNTDHYLWTAAVLLALGLVFSWRFEINVFGLNQFYRNRLVRCYLGATRWLPGLRKPHRFTGFDRNDDLELSELRHVATDEMPFSGPFPIVNCALNLGGSSDLSVHTRHSASFVLTPLRSGADRRAVGYAPSRPPGPVFAGGVELGQAISVSGAAASPNSGYSTSPLVAVLLTMFNVRLGWWFPNPGRRSWKSTWLRFSLWYLAKEMFAQADERNRFVNVSDGGHFDNLGIYELIRRRCKVIIASDAECDGDLAFGSLGSVVRMCETDFGAKIDIDVESIRRPEGRQTSRAHCAVGRITYANGSQGCLIYLKSSMTGDEDVSVAQYKAAHPAFPHESTSDQFFAEDQFESYRRLGHHVARLTFRDVEDEPSVLAMADKLADLWVPASVGSDLFVDQTEALDGIWERFRTSPSLSPLWRELTANGPSMPRGVPTDEELAACLSLFQLMENAFLALRLDDFWTHPDNRGWTVLFSMWAKSPCFQEAWRSSRNVFGSRFVHFCHQRLGLKELDPRSPQLGAQRNRRPRPTRTREAAANEVPRR